MRLAYVRAQKCQDKIQGSAAAALISYFAAKLIVNCPD